jgi:hypothetical protein
MSNLREIAYRVDPVLWVRDTLQMTPTPWQETFLRAPCGSSVIALTARQVGKTTTAAWAIAHTMIFRPGSLSVIACPAQRQSAEAVRRVRDSLIKAGAKLVSDNVYGLELQNGSRVLALPGSDDSIRGLTVDGWIVADEAARLTQDLIAALRPMRARRPEARFAMLSTAWSRTDPFWTAWASDDASWIRLKATAEIEGLFDPKFLETERQALGELEFKREYLGIPSGGGASLFTWDLYERATQVHTPLVAPGCAFQPTAEAPSVAVENPFRKLRASGGLTMHPEQPNTWPYFSPQIIAHDVGRTRDRSTAVVGGVSPFHPDVVGIVEFKELQQGLFGTQRASALAAVDRQHHSNALIVSDLSYDPSYAEVLFDTFGPRCIGIHISRYGDGMHAERRPIRNGAIPVYTIGRSYLFEKLHTELQADRVRLASGEVSTTRAFAQLEALETEHSQNGTIYTCPPGQHDDLAISCAILVWAGQHPHLRSWMNNNPATHRRRPRQEIGWGAFT